MLACGSTTGEVKTWLDNNGYKTKYNTSFTTGTINTLVRNEKYKGVYVYGKEKRIIENGVKKDITGDDIIKIPDGVPRIVSDELWDKVNKIYDERKLKAGGQAKAKECYLLSGLIYCGKCGGSMCGNRNKSGHSKTARVTYKCNTRKAKKECDAKDIRKDLVEAIVIDALDRELSDGGLDKIIEFIHKGMMDFAKSAPNELKELNKKLKSVETKINNIVEAIMNGISTPSTKQALNELEALKIDIIDRIDYTKKQCEKLQIPSKELLRSNMGNDMDIKNKSLDEQKRIIKTYVYKFVVYPEYVEIYWRFDLNMYVDTIDGAEGNRTPVRKPIHCSISHYSQSFMQTRSLLFPLLIAG